MDIVSRPDQRDREQRLQETLQTMDVVDELRLRQAELDKIALHDAGQLKARLAEIYRGQGIDVTDAILEAGIQARLDQRFVHVIPSGPAVSIAKLWIRRASVAHSAGSILLIVGVMAAGWHYFISAPAERRVAHAIQTINVAIDEIPSSVTSLRQELDAAQARLIEAVKAARSVPPTQRLEVPASRAESDANMAASRINSVLQKMERISIPRITREGYEQDRDRIIQMVKATRLIGVQTRKEIEGIDISARALARLPHAAVLLDQANASAEQLPAQDRVQTARRALFGAGEQALSNGEADAAESAAKSLQGLADASRRLDALRSSAVALLSAGRAMSPDASGAEALDRAYAALLDAIQSTDLSAGAAGMLAADAAGKALATMVEELGQEFTFTIVNREGVRTGVWRTNRGSPGTKNYYVVIEPVDAQGNAISLNVRNEESGRTESAKLLAVRVPKSQYEKVKADKLDNGLVDDNRVGRKRRGRLEVEFAMPVAGGYITQW